MDSTNLSETIIGELGEVFVTQLSQAGPDLLRTDFDGIEQRLRGLSRRVLSRVVEAVVATRNADAASDVPLCPICHQPMRLVEQQRLRQLQGLVGDYALHRAYFVCDPCQTGRAPSTSVWDWAPAPSRRGSPG